MAANSFERVAPPPSVSSFALPDLEEMDLLVSVEGDEGDGEAGENPKEEQKEQAAIAAAPHTANLAGFLSEESNKELATELLEEIETDLKSREEWEKMYKKGLGLLGLRIEERTEPWEGACGVTHPMLSEAALKFQAETIIETFPAAGPVLTKVIGRETPAKLSSAARVREDMNWLLTTKYREYRSEHERLLWTLPLAGSAFKKVYVDPLLGRPVSLFVPPEDIIVNYGAPHTLMAERITHRFSRSEIEYKKAVAAGVYLEVDDEGGGGLTEPETIKETKDKLSGQEDKGIEDEGVDLYEVYCWLDEEEEGLVGPHIVTIDRGEGKIVGLYRNWEENDKKQTQRHYVIHYQYVPGFGYYGLGLIHLIGGFADSATAIMRQLVDAGTLSNLPGGFKTRGLRIKQDDTPIDPGEWRDVEVLSGTLKDNLLPLPYKEPSNVLHGLLTDIVDSGYRVASMTDLKVADMKQDAPVGSTLALLERMLKPVAAVLARVHASMTDELQLLKGLVVQNEGPDYPYDADFYSSPPEADPASSTPTPPKPPTRQADYAVTTIYPVTDPNAATLTQRIAQFQTAAQLAAQKPEIYDIALMHRELLSHIGIKGADKWIPDKSKTIKPLDPVSENMAVLTGQPVKAGMEQNHDAHLQVHLSFMQDPRITQLVGQSAQAAVVQGAIQAHIAEHMAFKYRKDMEQALGFALPPPGKPMPPDAEAEIAFKMAQAAELILNQGKNFIAMQQAQDPLLELERRKLNTQELEVQRKIDKDEKDFLLEAMKLGLDTAQSQDQAAGEAQQQAIDLQQRATESALKTQEMIDNQIREGARAEGQQRIEAAQNLARLLNNQRDHQQKLKQNEEKHQQKMTMDAQVARRREEKNKRLGKE